MMVASRSILAICLLVAVAQAQLPTPQVGGAAPDTAVVHLSWPGADLTPTAISLFPDTLVFGDEALVILDQAADLPPLPLDSLQVDVPWLDLIADGSDLALPDLPAAAGDRQVVRFRVYREGPWRVAGTGGAASSVQLVTGRVDDLASVEPVRDPRAIGGVPRWLLMMLTALAVVLAVLGAWWRWRRGGRGQWEPAFAALPPPAWLQAATALRTLDQDAMLGRERLDGLALILRRYLEHRFFLAATEMTAPEIAAAARNGGVHAATLVAFADLVATCDDARYRPEHVGSQQVSEAMGRALDLIEAVRVQPRWTPVPAAELADAHAAWTMLRQRYPASDLDQERPAC